MFINEFFNKEQGLTEAANPAQQAAIAIAKKKKKGVAEDAENFNGIDISLEIQKDDEYVDDEDYDNQVIYVTASSNGRELGHVLFSIDGEYLMPQDLEVEERFRGQGIAQTMYDYVKSKGYKIRRSGQQTDAGAGFWDKHKGQGQNVWEQGVVEGSEQKYLWHGSRQKIPMLEPRQSVDTGGAAGSNQNAIYATSDPKVAIAVGGLTTPDSDTAMFPNDPQMVLFSGKIRKGENVYLHKLPFYSRDGKPQFVQGAHDREFYSIPGVKGIKPTEIKAVPVDKYLNLIRKATPADLELRKKNMKEQGVAENAGQPLSVQQLATISDAALDAAYGYGRSAPGNTFGWQANLKSAAFAKQMIDQGVTDIEAISDAIHKGWNTTAQAFVQDPEQFDDTAKLAAAGKLEAKLQQRAQLMKQNYGQLPEEEKEKDRVVARALLQAMSGQQGVAEGQLELNTPDPVVVVQDLKGNILDKINLSVAAQKYKLGQPQNIKTQLAHQNYTKVGNYTIVSPMSGQPQDQTTTGQKQAFTATEGEQQPGADYIDPPEDKDPNQYGDDYQAMVARV